MRIALVHDFITGYTGAERVLKVFADMFPSAPIFTLLYDEALHDIFPKERVQVSDLQKLPRFIRKRRKFLLSSFPRAIEQFDFSDFDLVISSSGAFSKGILTKPETLHVCYCHAPMRYAWDWNQEYLEEHHMKGIKKLVVLQLLKKVRMWDFLSSKRPDLYIANSKATAQKINKYYHRNSVVVFPPVDTARFKGKDRKNGDFYFIVSRLEPYKRIDIAIDTFNKHPEKKLVIIGTGSAEEALKARATSSNISFLGFQNDDVITDHYLACKAFLFPGEDDFGITAVEAMSAGKPVIAFARGGTLETIVEGKTGVFFHEPNAESFELALSMFEENSTTFDELAISTHAENFSKETFIATILNEIDQLKSRIES
jgi:glycosyltransferase involved in cell wall biosynthesis